MPRTFDDYAAQQCITVIRAEVETPLHYGGERFGYEYRFDHNTLYGMSSDWDYAVVEVLRFMQRQLIDHCGLPLESKIRWTVINPIQLPMRSK